MPKENVPTPGEVSAAVEAWFAKNFRNNVLSRNTEIYNVAVMAKADLTATICGLFKPAAEVQKPATTDGDDT